MEPNTLYEERSEGHHPKAHSVRNSARTADRPEGGLPSLRSVRDAARITAKDACQATEYVRLCDNFIAPYAESRLDLPQGPPSVSDYALVRRQFQIFERALKKFKSDVGLWIQYIQTAKREGARALVGRITARHAFPQIVLPFANSRNSRSSRALQLHPNVPSLYVLAASHELDHLSPAAARTLLQRGLRLNVDSVELWREYVKMELGFVESIRRRWEVLGISLASQAKGKAKEANGLDENIESTPFADRPPVDTDQDAQAEADMARHEILEGAIVKSVLENAVKGELVLPFLSHQLSRHSNYTQCNDLACPRY